MKVWIDQDLCTGDGLCEEIAPAVFTLLDDGRVLVFEANATMLVHRERADGEFAHKNAYVQRIGEAFEAMMAARIAPRG